MTDTLTLLAALGGTEREPDTEYRIEVGTGSGPWLPVAGEPIYTVEAQAYARVQALNDTVSDRAEALAALADLGLGDVSFMYRVASRDAADWDDYAEDGDYDLDEVEDEEDDPDTAFEQRYRPTLDQMAGLLTDTGLRFSSMRVYADPLGLIVVFLHTEDREDRAYADAVADALTGDGYHASVVTNVSAPPTFEVSISGPFPLIPGS